MTANTEKPYPPEKSENQYIQQIRQILRETKTNKISKLRKEIEFLERRMQGVKTKLDRLQQDPAQTPSISIIGIRQNNL